ncbi:cytochrome P450 monooxygenase pc-3 [Trametes sanguinea]|nr:cytochrome P450 monooxygenase pc-3 [Trametes sanguinea]
MPSLPPGPRYLIAQLPNVLAPPVIIYVLAYFARAQLNLNPPAWLLAVAYILSWPVALTVRVQWHDYVNRRRARALGAVMPPAIAHRWPGSLDLLRKVFVADKTRYMTHSLLQWADEYGSVYNFRVMFEDRIMTTEPEHIKMMLSTEFNHYEKGPLLNEQLNTLLGQGVFNSDGEMWKFHRTITRPFFSKDRITHFDIFDRHAEHALNKMSERLRQGVPVDWQDVVSRFTMDSATEFLFGKDVRSLDAPLPYPSAFARAAGPAPGDVHPADRCVRAFEAALEATSIRGRFLQSWPLFEFWGDRVKKHLRAIDEFVDPIVDDLLRTKAEKVAAGVETDDSKEQVRDDETLLEHLAKFTDDPKHIKDEILNILIAGRDTTSATLTFAVYALAEHKDVLARLRAEVLSVVGPSARPTYDHIREMKYMRAFINEVLRLWPAVPVNSRCSIGPMTWKSTKPGEPDYYIPPRTRLLYSVLIMQRRNDLWGPDAMRFDPDRFLDERVQTYLVANPFIFLPFNAGPRICLGQQFAYNEVSFMLVRLLQRFASVTLRQDAHPAAVPPPGAEFSPYAVDGRERVWMRSHLTAYAKNGLWVEMEEAVSE